MMSKHVKLAFYIVEFFIIILGAFISIKFHAWFFNEIIKPVKETVVKEKTYNDYFVQDIAYTQDKRTKICFVRSNIPYRNSFAFTYVPCTKEVLTQIKIDEMKE